MNEINFNHMAEESTGSKTLPVGPQISDVNIDSCTWEKGQGHSSEWCAMDFTYSKNGNTLRDRMFIPNKETTRPRPFIENDTQENAYVAKSSIFNKQLTFIAKALNCEDEFLGCTTYEQACEVFNNNRKNNTVWLKTTKNKDGYVECCRGNSAMNFIQCSTEPCELKYSTDQQTKLDQVNSRSMTTGINQAELANQY